MTLIAELNLNDIKGVDAPSLDAWSTAAGLAAVTQSLELMVAVRPTFHLPALLAKQAANIDHISGGGRVSLNVVSSWWAEEAKKYGVHFDQHDDRYARTSEWLDVVDAAWKQDHVSYSGKYYQVRDLVLQPKPVSKPRPTIYAGGESEAAKELISQKCDAYVMHGDPPARIAEKIRDMAERREKKNLGRMQYGVAAYAIVRESEAEAQEELRRITDVKQNAAGYKNYQQWLANTQLEHRVSLEEYSVSNRGLRRVWWALRSRWRIGSGNLSGPASICCCCNSARNSRRWSEFSELVIRQRGSRVAYEIRLATLRRLHRQGRDRAIEG